MQMQTEDLQRCMTKLPRDVTATLVAYNLIVGGGFVRACVREEPVHDIDVFGCDRDLLKAAAQEIASQRAGRVVSTENAETVIAHGRVPLQFIHRWLFKPPLDVCLSFDFTICQAVLYPRGEEWRGLVSDMFYPDLAARRLRYTKPVRDEDAGGSLLRAFKYARRGYYLPPEQLAAVVARLVVGGKVTTGVGEESVSNRVQQLLREVDPTLDAWKQDSSNE